MEWTQECILQEVQLQLSSTRNEKSSSKKGMRRTYMRLYKTICHLLFATSDFSSENIAADFNFGQDEFGRDVAKGLLAYVEILKNRRVGLHTVIVLGSRVKNRSTPQSDIDVMIIASNLPKEIKTIGLRRLLGLRRWFLLSDIPLFLGVEPSQCCSPSEFLNRLNEFNIHPLDALYYGKIIYDDGFWQKAQERFRELNEKYGLEKLDLKTKLLIV